jgi:hypothetical protein
MPVKGLLAKARHLPFMRAEVSPMRPYRLAPLVLILFMLVYALPAAPAQAADKKLPAADRQIINTMIDRVAHQSDIHFIRKGSEHSASEAAQFMKGKWNWWSDHVHSVADFITLMSAGNFGTGTPYYIKLADGTTIRSHDYLTKLAAQVRHDQAQAQAKAD